MLAIHPCRSACDWAATGTSYDERPVFACAGCGSEWARSAASCAGWSPRQLDGSWPPGVREELDQRG